MIRAATLDETDVVRDALETIQDGLADALLAGDALLVVDREGVEAVTAVAPAVLDLPEWAWQEADHAGLRIGTLQDGTFQLDVQGAVLCASQSKSQTARVTERAARLFLYGRDIIGDSVEWGDPRLRKGAVCIVCNPRGEGLGLGEMVATFRGQRTSIINLIDLGVYLREQDQK